MDIQRLSDAQASCPLTIATMESRGWRGMLEGGSYCRRRVLFEVGNTY
jgi:hypothetical protein